MSEDSKKIKVEFAPGCFDNFDGTQEELDQLVNEITRMAESGELVEDSVDITVDDIFESLTEEDIESIEKILNEMHNRNTRQ